ATAAAAAAAPSSAATASSSPARARRSLGRSDIFIHTWVARCLRHRHGGGGTLIDVGCGSGGLWAQLRAQFDRYIGVGLIRYDGFPEAASFIEVDLNTTPLPMGDGLADVVAAVETIEHLENPRSFLRELNRLLKPGGWAAVSTPNQLSLLSKAT